jgi:hypothetical protein
MTLSETEAALASIVSEMQVLQQRRASLAAHRSRLLGAADGEDAPPNMDEIDDIMVEPPPLLQSARSDAPALPPADLRRWSGDFPWSKQVDELKKQCVQEQRSASKRISMERLLISPLSLSLADTLTLIASGLCSARQSTRRSLALTAL